MADSKIEWTQRVWNPIVGCTIHSPGCKRCYAMRMAWRLQGMAAAGNEALAHYAGTVEQSKAGPVWTGKVSVAPDDVLTAPLRRKKPTTYFVNSMSDLFHADVPDEVIDRVFAVMALCPQHTFQVLTKRADRMRQYFEGDRTQYALAALTGHILGKLARPLSWPHSVVLPLPNVWLGVSVEDQQRADERLPHLLATPAAIRWLSCEPLLGPVDLTRVKRFPAGTADKEFINAVGGRMWTDQTGLPNPDPSWAYPGRPFSEGRGLDWIVVGGESGSGARPMHPTWTRSLRDQCAEACVPFFFKQWGEWGLDPGPLDDGPPYRDPVMEGAACAVLVDSAWQHFPSAYAPPIELCSGHGEFVYRLGKKRNGRLLDGVEHNGMPEVRHG